MSRLDIRAARNLERNGIKKTYKKISSDLQYALTKPFVRLEDTQNAGANKAFC